MMLITGCSLCRDRTESLWTERQVEGDQGIYENPNESWNRWEGIELDENKTLAFDWSQPTCLLLLPASRPPRYRHIWRFNRTCTKPVSSQSTTSHPFFP